MQKDKKSKNDNIKKLRKILDNIPSKDLHPKDEKYLSALSERLEESSKGIVYRKTFSKVDSKKEIDLLKPKVTIHPREVKKVLEFTEIKEEKTELEIEEPSAVEPLPAKEIRYEDEDVFEVEKVEVSEPEFVEVKPKETAKEEKEETFEEKKALGEEELTEWEAVEKAPEKEEIKEEPKKAEILEEKTEDKERIEVTDKFCGQCGAKLRDEVDFCPECGNKIITDQEKPKKDESEPVEEIEPIPTFIPIKEVEKKEEGIKTEEEPAKLGEKMVEVEEPPVEEIYEEPGIDIDSKIEAFKDMESVADETAVILYDSGYTTIDSLKEAALKDLTKIKGIKRKVAKNIKKEIEKMIEESAEVKSIFMGETTEGKLTEDQVQEEVVEKEELPSPVEVSAESSEWKSVTEEKVEEPKELDIDRENKIEVFKDLECINDETAVLLYDSGYTTIDALTVASLKDLAKIKGIKKNTIKKIKKELGQKSEWEPIEIKEEPIEEKEPIKLEPVEEEIIESEEKIGAFKDIKSIDEETSVLLYDSGYTTIDSLKEAALKDLTKIKGIKKKTAKKIKKELEQKSELEPEEVKEDENEYLMDDEEFSISEAEEIDNKIKEYKPLEPEEEFFKDEEVEDIPPIKSDEEDVFKNISSVDEKIAKLLKENGINSIYDLRNTTVKELTKIKGIKRKIAKKIKKEVEEFSADKYAEEILPKESPKDSFERGENPFIKEEEEWESFDEDKISDSELREIKGFRHGDYTLYAKEIDTKSGKKRTVRFFSKAEPEEGEPIELPKDYKVEKNKKTGVPYLKKKK